MKSIRRFRKKVKIFVSKLGRIVTRGTWDRTRKTKQERNVSRIVRTLLNTPDSKVYCLPGSSRISITPKDKKYIITFDDNDIKISNHKFFFNASLRYNISQELISLATERLKNDLKKLNAEVVYNEENFLDDVYVTLKKNKDKYHQMNSASQECELPIEKIVSDYMLP